uniref:Uncharacterized protein n=1 Tax=Picea glauca TaxID=3330 RepID=A0A101LTR8_PICGL|nr:hypothetical protein ABT39_MTgene3582 [Picea glauca]QHR89025.1 hypothetical protein Q903MT_gene3044 [Picea sitchensis]
MHSIQLIQVSMPGRCYPSVDPSLMHRCLAFFLLEYLSLPIQSNLTYPSFPPIVPIISDHVPFIHNI